MASILTEEVLKELKQINKETNIPLDRLKRRYRSGVRGKELRIENLKEYRRIQKALKINKEIEDLAHSIGKDEGRYDLIY